MISIGLIDIHAKAAHIKLACFDVDGVLTDGRLSHDGANEYKSFHVHDGLGIKLLLLHGVEVALITARTSSSVVARAAELGVRRVFQGVKDKLATLNEIARELSIMPEEIAYGGDDLPDLNPMQKVGLAIAVANAHPWVIEKAHACTRKTGGAGAVREICDFILEAKGLKPAILRDFGIA